MNEQTSQLSFRLGTNQDCISVLNLYNQVFHRDRLLENWEWAYVNNVVGRTDMLLACANNRIIGNSSSVPLWYRSGGQRVLTSRVQDVMVDPSWRGKGIFLETLRRLTEHLEQTGNDFVVTFPNDNSLPSFTRKLNYQLVEDIATHHMTVGPLTFSNPAWPALHVETSGKFMGSDTTFIQQMLSKVHFYNERSPEYMRWRYASASGKTYNTYRLQIDGKLAALIVVKYYEPGNALDLVELFCLPDKEVVFQVLGSILSDFYDRGSAVKEINLWLRESDPLYAILSEIGFTPTDHHTHIVFRSFSHRCPLQANKDSFYLSMGDSDVY